MHYNVRAYVELRMKRLSVLLNDSKCVLDIPASHKHWLVPAMNWFEDSIKCNWFAVKSGSKHTLFPPSDCIFTVTPIEFQHI